MSNNNNDDKSDAEKIIEAAEIAGKVIIGIAGVALGVVKFIKTLSSDENKEETQT